MQVTIDLLNITVDDLNKQLVVLGDLLDFTANDEGRQVLSTIKILQDLREQLMRKSRL